MALLITSLKRNGMKRIRLRGERGAATVEFAMVAIVLLMIVFGIIEFGILMFDQHVLTNSSREGARAGIVMRVPRLPDVGTSPEEGIKDIVIKYAEEHMVSFGASSTLDINVSPDEIGRGAKKDPDGDIHPPPFGTMLTVTVTYPFDFLVLSGFGLGPITLTAETRMRME
jgi:hypothetical protein